MHTLHTVLTEAGRAAFERIAFEHGYEDARSCAIEPHPHGWLAGGEPAHELRAAHKLVVLAHVSTLLPESTLLDEDEAEAALDLWVPAFIRGVREGLG
jgi:hypothetical protein